jgi:hypothetical protein
LGKRKKKREREVVEEEHRGGVRGGIFGEKGKKVA